MPRGPTIIFDETVVSGTVLLLTPLVTALIGAHTNAHPELGQYVQRRYLAWHVWSVSRDERNPTARDRWSLAAVGILRRDLGQRLRRFCRAVGVRTPPAVELNFQLLR